MKKYFLVTTALENTWPEDESEPTLFLGEWCRLYSRKERWEMMNVEVLPYHWDDRKKLFNDYQYLRALNERILESLANSLNQYHQVNYSLRYWRIVVGPWLMMVLPVLYDRWECIRLAVSTYEINKTYITDKISEDVTPVSMEHFSSIIMSDEWNHLMYAKVLDFMKFKRATKKKLINYDLCIAGSSCSKKSNINLFKKVISSTFSLMARNNEYFFIDTYLKKSDVVRLCLKLKQFPGMYQDEGYSSSCQIEMERLSMLEGFFPDNEFEGFVKKVLPLHMPIAYFEGYNQLIGEVKKKYWPSNSKVIWTSNSFYMNEHFKVWSAYKVEKGSSLVIGQHGGHYGQGLFSFIEYHELKISDYYLSWGWGNNRHTIPFGRIRMSLESKNKKVSNKKLLLLLSGTSRYSNGVISIPIAGQWLDYFNDQVEFYANLSLHITNNTVIRLYPHDYQWFQSERLLDKFPNVAIDYCDLSLESRLIKTKLFVGGWNSTAYLEAMGSNIPTIIFWDNRYFEIRKEVVEMFEALKKVQIFHDSPVSAAKHVESIWGNVDEWWYRDDVQKTKNDFVNCFANASKTIDDLEKIFKGIYECNLSV